MTANPYYNRYVNYLIEVQHTLFIIAYNLSFDHIKIHDECVEDCPRCIGISAYDTWQRKLQASIKKQTS